VQPPPLLLVDQRDAFSKLIPENHERDRNVPADCKTELPQIAAARGRDRIARAALINASPEPERRRPLRSSRVWRSNFWNPLAEPEPPPIPLRRDSDPDEDRKRFTRDQFREAMRIGRRR
jgi:hypothetical protein